MVRKYKRNIGVRRYRDYTDENLEEALQKVTVNEYSLRKAASEYGIPFGTLYNKYKGLHVRKVGHPTIFSAQEEQNLVKCAAVCGDWGYPLSKEDMCFLQKIILIIKAEPSLI
ncbi:helix-turn-helix psq domain [Holotrichia oblita]|uniref:Helix-turn-helix psq domain n=1 Tax=Holotrichia oblita TaxID=644536 RepID=A0ACB9TJ99_HOLOL|nr:helix-turn-helix psq domain [Holotrichia oblita]